MSDNYAPAVGQIIGLLGGQNAVAKRLGLTQSSVWRWAHGAPIGMDRIEQLIAMAAEKRIELRPDHFFGRAPLPGAAPQDDAA